MARGPTSSDGRPVTVDDARRIASDLGFEPVEDRPDDTPARAACQACGWSSVAPIYAAAGDAARGQAGDILQGVGPDDLLCERCTPHAVDAYPTGMRAGQRLAAQQ